MQYTGAMNAPLSEVLAAYRARLEAIYGERLKSLILFGSRARGDARADSDIDVMIVLEGPIRWSAETDRTAAATTEIDTAFGVDIMRAFATPEEHRSRDRSFYRNVRQEGIAV